MQAGEAFAAGRETGRALHRVGVDVDLAPVLDSPSGPLGSRHFRRAWIRRRLRARPCDDRSGPLREALPRSRLDRDLDGRHPVHGIMRAKELAGFRAAVEAGVPCVMVSHARYRRFGPDPASLEPKAYELLRDQGFHGVAITDDGVLGHAGAPEWARRAVLAGADLVLYSRPSDARRAIDALVPLARRGLLDEHVFRVLRFREEYGPS